MLERLMSQMVTVEDTTTTDNLDFLAGTQLDQPGVPGVYTVWAACSDDNGKITIGYGGRQVASEAAIVRRTNQEIRENEDPFYQVVVPTGGRPVISVDVGSGQTARVRIKFLPAVLT